jgi:hypothetical protein
MILRLLVAATQHLTPQQQQQPVYQTVGYCRQNSWTKMYDPLDAVKVSKKIHIPWVHTKGDVDEYLADPANYANNGPGSQFVNIIMNFPTDSLVLIPNGKHGLIVRIKSGVKAGIVESLAIACSTRTCGHSNVNGGHKCVECDNSVKEVISSENTRDIVKHLKSRHILEPFWGLYRDVEVVAHADYNGTDGRSLAGPNSAGNWTHNWTV